jgi:hypothetical protein
MKLALFVVEIENEVLDINGHFVLVSIESLMQCERLSRFAVASGCVRRALSLTGL